MGCIYVSCFMKNTILTLIIASIIPACAAKADSFTLKNNNGAEACITNYGARLVSLRVPDRQGVLRDVVLGFDDIAAYLEHPSTFGAVIGRYANCIGEGCFYLDGQGYTLPRNKDGRHCMHGGPDGFQNKFFSARKIRNNILELKLVSPDQEAGFPGELSLKVRYTLGDDNSLRIDYLATTTRPTVLNLTNHSFFNLSGNPSRDVIDYRLSIDADRFLEKRTGSPVPTGKFITVEGTAYDFRTEKQIGHENMPDEGYNLNYVLNHPGNLSIPAASCICPESGITLTVYTDQPGLQLYTAENLDGSLTGKGGVRLQKRKAVCLETQHFPDSPNHPEFPSTVLRPGEKFSSSTIYAFSVDTTINREPRDIYLDLMEEAVDAYTPERIQDYLQKVEAEGITEHGFARLVSNIGILVSHGRLPQYKDLFVRLMDVCTKELPVAKQKNQSRGEIGNDFAVKEVSCCIYEAEKSGMFHKETTDAWRRALEGMVAEDIYSVQPAPGDETAHNWCVYGAASECARLMVGIGGDRSYADRYLGDQLRFFDDNGMYRDPGAPMVYDFVTRLQYMAALDFGYDGPAKEGILEQLRKSAIPTLQMLSASGEIPYGGRSNRFLHNESFYAAVCEYYARWMNELGEKELARRFKAAALKSVSSILFWLKEKPVHHIKNRYPSDSGYGCEPYAHFNKYMVTMGSWAYLAWRFSDDTIEPAADLEPASTFVTGPDFHRVFMNAGGYSVQFDLDAQPQYDSDGIGRFQKIGVPPTVGLASPCPAAEPNYKLDIVNDGGLALAPIGGKFKLISARKRKVVLSDGKATWICRLSRKGLRMTLKGEDVQTMMIPAVVFDGENSIEPIIGKKSLEVHRDGAICVWKTNGTIVDTGKEYANRDGHLRRYDVSANRRLSLRGRIVN